MKKEKGLKTSNLIYSAKENKARANIGINNQPIRETETPENYKQIDLKEIRNKFESWISSEKSPITENFLFLGDEGDEKSEAVFIENTVDPEPVIIEKVEPAVMGFEEFLGLPSFPPTKILEDFTSIIISGSFCSNTETEITSKDLDWSFYLSGTGDSQGFNKIFEILEKNIKEAAKITNIEVTTYSSSDRLDGAELESLGLELYDDLGRKITPELKILSLAVLVNKTDLDKLKSAIRDVQPDIERELASYLRLPISEIKGLNGVNIDTLPKVGKKIKKKIKWTFPIL